MGAVKTEELANGNIGFEIAYGGLQAPFGGVDTSAPPSYIDPRCFTAAQNFLVVDNKLVATSFVPLTVPTLWNNTSGVSLLKAGVFYNSIYGYLQYALGVIITPTVGPPTYTTYQFFLTSWQYDNNLNPQRVNTDTITIKFFESVSAGVAATLTIPLIKGEVSTFTDSGTVGLEFFNNGTSLTTVTTAYTSGSTVNGLLTALVSAINAAGPLSGVLTAAPSADGLSLVLTAANATSLGNLLSVSDQSSSSSPGLTPAFYFGVDSAFFFGGKDQVFNQPPASFPSVSVAAEGGVLYIANIGPCILKYSGPGTLTISTMYAGVQVLGKFAGSLIGLGDIPNPLDVVSNTDMIVSWTVPDALDEWSPVTTAGLVTGAGFAQLSDIGDYLVGLIVSNNTGFIIRAKGISYMYGLSNTTDPFEFVHVALGAEGEGCADPNLVCQYDQVGAFIGNSDIYQVSGEISPIGEKIKAAVFAILNDFSKFAWVRNSSAQALYLGGDTFVCFSFLIANTLFVLNASNKTWMTFDLTTIFNNPNNQVVQTPIYTSAYNLGEAEIYIPNEYALLIQDATSGVVSGYLLTETTPNTVSSGTQCSVTFPQEEITIGRDVTIDALYLSLYGNIHQGDTVQLRVSYTGLQPSAADPAIFERVSILFTAYDMTAEFFNSLSGIPVEMQLFPNNGETSGAFTVHSPQLTITLQATNSQALSQVRLTKVVEFGSVDPKQRPV